MRDGSDDAGAPGGRGARRLLAGALIGLVACGGGTATPATEEGEAAATSGASRRTWGASRAPDPPSESAARGSSGEAPTEEAARARRGAGGWVLRFRRPATERPPEPQALTVGPGGRVVASLVFFGTMRVGGRTFEAEGGADAWLGALSGDGTLRRQVAFGGEGIDAVLGVDVGPDGRELVGGMVSGAPPLVEGAKRDDGGRVRLFAVGLSPDGAPRWHVGPEAAEGDAWSQIEDVAIGADGEALAVGSFRGQVGLPGGTRMRTRYWDGLAMELGAGDGRVAWSRQLRSGHSAWLAVTAAPGGGYVAVGRFENQVDAGRGLHRSKGDADVIVARYDADGEPQWSSRSGEGATEDALDVEVIPGGPVVVLTQRTDSPDTSAEVAHPGPRLVALHADDGKYAWEQRIEARAAALAGVTASGELWTVTLGARQERNKASQLRVYVHDAGGERVARHVHDVGRVLEGPLFASLAPNGKLALLASVRESHPTEGVTMRTPFLASFPREQSPPLVATERPTGP